MKILIAISILSLLFFTQIGYRFIYLIQQHELKEQAEQQILSTISDDQLEQVTVEDNKIVWEEEGKEFTLNGEMYDVARKERINGKTILYCLNDTRESQLIDEMIKKASSNADNNSNTTSKQTLKFQLSDFIADNPRGIFFPAKLTIPKYQQYLVPVCTVIKEVNTPPPNNNLYFKH